jgi:O-antigen ligase/polysaccharide polymerase Wzy-like membrane protein
MLGEPLSLAILVSFGVFFLVIVAFMSVPHISVAAMIPIFILLPMLKVLFVPWLGPLKDIIGLAAICAGAALVVQRANSNQKALADFWVTIMVGFLMALYIVNLGGGLQRDLAWAHGVRLFSEPLFLLLVGLTLGDARRTFRWMMASLIASACFVALVGIAQQALGDVRLVQMGYEYNTYVRFIGGHLRSFGSLDDPFGYAAFLLFGLAAVFIWMRRGILAYLAGTIISIGLVFSYVRSAAVIGVALIALVLARHGRYVIAGFLTVTVIVSGMLLVASEQAIQKRTLRGGKSAYVTINGRTKAWKVVFEDPWDLPLGRGVGQVGTAAERATYTISRGSQPCTRRACNEEVDSGYFATIADIGLVGLVGLLLLNGRLAVLARRAAVRGSPAGWTALSFLAILMLDAITRESFSAFPTAFLGLLFVGIAVRASAEETEAEPRRALRRA